MKINKGLKMIMLLLCGVLILGLVPKSYAALNVPVSRSVTVEATVSGTNTLTLSLKNISDDQSATKVTFASASGIATAAQYIQVDFNSNASGSRVILRTDNRNSATPFTGTGEGAGLVGNADSKITSPLLWAVFDDVAPAKAFVFKGDTDPSGSAKGSLPGSTERGAGEAEGLVVDKANPNYETPGVLGYATVILPDPVQGGDKGLLGNFPTDVDGSGPSTGLRPCTSPVFVVIGADFVNLPAQTYSTNTLALDLVVQ